MGKFAPLHKGHQFLIETAIKKMDEVIVMIYNAPSVTDVPLDVRANWIRKLYSKVKVIEAWDGPEDNGHSERIKKINEDYILKKITVPITHFFSSEWYGEHVSKVLGAKNVVVDEARKKFPISGTLIRANVFENRKFLDPVVYSDLITKVVFVGAESTGKTTISKRLSEEYETAWMPEYGREYWDEHHDADGFLTPEQLADLAKGHLEREDQIILDADKYFFVDTNAITTEMFSNFYHGFAHPDLKKLAKENEKRYDLYFLCDIDIPYEDEPGRSGAEHRIVFQKEIIDDLNARGIKYITLRGNLEARIGKVKEVLGKFRKYSKNDAFVLQNRNVIQSLVV